VTNYPVTTHLRYLRIAHLATSGIFFIVMVFASISLNQFWAERDIGTSSMLVLHAPELLCMLSICIMLVFTAWSVGRGRGRIPATLVSATTILGPLIIVFVYTVWICWVNPETKAVFAAGGLQAE